ncbi:Putative ribosomal protein L28/L24 [Septoria linicola]|uniref:Large ribosomal subunit protein bL28m n=1 Tax=Septoria linicola TaxID=215465 RepID=A0A9Q9AKQ4_9PEZI|nr:putative ribosomal protein L28/L24 [Septoria linicola]USW47736.1 Putative ribosomal protein L28/L24 [Septoria linicola]
MAALFRPSRAICQCQRSFSTSIPRAVSLQWDKNDSDALAEVLPPYPYGPAQWYKQSNRGLYGGQRKQFGNNVSGDFDTKTRRTWKPNVFTRKLFSKALNRYVQVKVSSRVLRTIDKLGGLDEYLLGEKEARIKQLGESGWWLRWAILQTPQVRARFAAEREALGLPADADQLSAVEAALSEPGEEGEADTEAVVLDGAFQVEHNPHLPPIKFRVGPRQHVMLTADGWVRTRPDPQRWVNMAKKKVQEQHFSEWLEKRSAVMESQLQLRQANAEISEQEAKEILRDMRRELRVELQAKVDKVYNRQENYRNEIALRKKEEKKRQRKGGETEQSYELELDA